MKVVGIGAGGHAKVVIEILQCIQGCEIIGLLDKRKELWKSKLLGVEVLGDDSLLPALRDRGVNHAFLGVGSVGDNRPRRELYQKMVDHGFQMVTAIHPLAWVSPSANIGTAATIMAGAVIGSAARLGDNVIVNTKASVDHDCVVGDHVHVSAGVSFGGGVSVGARTMIGIGAVIMPGIMIGADAVVGAGSVVTKDVPNNVVVIGYPARIVRNNLSLES